ncbi:unnamed protein product, partial [Polarella glacialis]
LEVRQAGRARLQGILVLLLLPVWLKHSVPGSRSFAASKLKPVSSELVARPATGGPASVASPSDVTDVGVVSDVPDVGAALAAVLTSIRDEAAERPVRLVAVSKFQSAAAVQSAHEAGQVDFGENYVQELVQKVAELPQSIRWHFIGKLQSNKVRKLLQGAPQLTAIETVDSAGLADRICTVALELGRGIGDVLPLDIFVQVDTSGEATKGGVMPGDANALAAHIVQKCGPSLRLAGLMTIGAPGDDSAFDRLRDARDRVAAEIGVRTLEQ